MESKKVLPRKIIFPEIEAELARRGENYEILGLGIGLTKASVQRRMSGVTPWALPEIKATCEYFGKSFYELFVTSRE